MKVTGKDVLYVADLGNLELTEAERARMLRDLNSILEYIDRLNRLDTSNVEPMAEVAERYGTPGREGSARFGYAMRPDQRRPSLQREEALRSAPQANDAFFKVPKVIEK